ncbi:MAG: RagB/SusD family nutrient uptake outer membrane protein [Tannerellaceae bacterium]|nr:RagB/SusD family nutrient uptake outer membrane protein [Tannerellaceae bacterium]
MKAIHKIIGSFLLVGLLSSCLGDLDTLPLDDSMTVAEQVYQDKANYKGVLAKCYAVLAITGQQGPGGQSDVVNGSESYSSYIRAFFYLQSVSTDEALSTSTSNGMQDLVTNTWTPQTEIIFAAYGRIYQAIGYCNEFLRQSTPEKLADRGQDGDAAFVAEIEDFRNEARFIRAYCYWVICDVWGSGPFFTDADPISGKFLPPQKSRKEIFDYVESELKELETKLMEPKANEYARVDKVSAWFLLSRLYLNAEIYTGTARWSDCLTYAEKVIASPYVLADKFLYNFLADNHTSPEIIWALNFDGERSKSNGGTVFLVRCQGDGRMFEHIDLGVSDGWANIRLREEYAGKFDPADREFDPADPAGNNKKDKRSLFFTVGLTQEIPTLSSSSTAGYQLTKWRNVTKDGTPGKDGANVDTDYPVFRTADAYLMAAEAILRGGGGSPAKALEYLNIIRDRAYESGSFGPNPRHPLTEGEMTLDYILDERARELAWELIRRTDLIRFGRYTGGENFTWRGGVATGKQIDQKYNLFPLPVADVTANPNLTQNPDFQN